MSCKFFGTIGKWEVLIKKSKIEMIEKLVKKYYIKI